MSAPKLPLRLTGSFLLAGALMSAGYAPLSLWWLLPIGIALWAITIRRCTDLRPAIFGSLITSAIFFLIVLHWSSSYVGWFPWVTLSLFEALFLAPVGLAMHAFKKSAWLPLLIGGTFVLDEAIRSHIPWGGFGWARLAFVQPSYFTKIASLGGAPLLTFALATLAGFLAVLLSGARSPKYVFAVIVLLLTPLAIPANRATQVANVAAVQGDVPRLGLDFNAQREAVLRYHVQTTQTFASAIRGGEAKRPSLIVWPENASDVDPLHDESAKQMITQITDEVGVPILVGGVTEAPYVQNISVLWVPSIGATSIYIKQHLAPFGEYLPLRSIAEALVPAAKRIVDMKPGKKTVTHQIGAIHLADVICFEIIEDELVRKAIVSGDANLLAVQTNSATFGRSSESEQQLAVSRERAIEHGRSIVSASTSGKSALIAPDGTVLKESGFFESTVLQANLPITDRLTIADQLGRWPELVMIFFTVVAFLRRTVQGVKK